MGRAASCLRGHQNTGTLHHGSFPLFLNRVLPRDGPPLPVALLQFSFLENLPLEFSGSLGLSSGSKRVKSLCLGLNASVLQLQDHRQIQVGDIIRHLFSHLPVS